jgi:hypothetical protein
LDVISKAIVKLAERESLALFTSPRTACYRPTCRRPKES